MAAVAPASSAASLGLDLERLLPPEQAAEIRAMVASAPEYACLHALGLNEVQMVGVLFSGKEAAYKCLRPTAPGDFGFTELYLCAAGAGQLHLQHPVHPASASAASVIVQWTQVEGLVMAACALPPSL